MVFKREHLLITHYNWTKNVNGSTYAGTPGRRMFDRHDGNQLLFLINFFGESIGNLTLQDGHKIEELINNQLPSGVRSELAVFNWLRGIYLYHAH